MFRLCVLLLVVLYQGISYANSACGNNPQANKLVELIRQHPEQQRTKIKCQARLAGIAEYKAQLLSQNDVIMHNIGYLTPNQLLREHGYPLSRAYPVMGNQVEAIAAGHKTAEATLEQLLNSQSHRNLILGQADFYQLQNEIGIAYLQQQVSPYDHYWVIHIADTHRPKTEAKFEHQYKFSIKDNSQDKLSPKDRLNHFKEKRPLKHSDY